MTTKNKTSFDIVKVFIGGTRLVIVEVTFYEISTSSLLVYFTLLVWKFSALRGKI